MTQPGQPTESDRQLQRERYRQLQTDTEKKRNDLINPGNQGLFCVLRDANEVITEVMGTREAALDAQIISLVSDLGDEQLRNIKTDIVHFDPRVFNQKILTMLGGRMSNDLESLDWSALGKKVSKVFRSAPTVDFLYGALDIQPMKQKVQRQRYKKEPLGEAKKPREIKQLEEEEEATTKDVSHLLAELRKACDESGVEADVIQEGRAGVKVLDNQPYVFIPTDVDEAGQAHRPNTNQSIVSLDMDLWKEITDKYELEPFQPRVQEQV